MLVLTRKPGQSVYIGDDVKITLHGIRGNQVRIGIEAPPSVKIYREEIYLQILDENKSAASDTPTDLESMQRAWAEKKPMTINAFAKKKPERDEEDDGE